MGCVFNIQVGVFLFVFSFPVSGEDSILATERVFGSVPTDIIWHCSVQRVTRKSSSKDQMLPWWVRDFDFATIDRWTPY